MTGMSASSPQRLPGRPPESSPETSPERSLGTRKVRLILVGFLVGLAFLVPQALAAWLSVSVVLWADLVRSVMEVVVKGMSWQAARRAAQGETVDYTYGLGKLEDLTGLLIAGAMVVSVAFVGHHAVLRILDPEQMRASALGLATVSCMAVVNALFWRRFKAMARALRSPLMESKWRLYRGRTLANACVCLTLVLSDVLGKAQWAVYLDPATSLLLCLFMLVSARDVARRSVQGLTDKALEEALQLRIIKVLTEHFEDWTEVHGIRSRRSGPLVFIELFLGFDPDMTMGKAQAVMDGMRERLEREIPGSRVTVAPSSGPVN